MPAVELRSKGGSMTNLPSPQSAKIVGTHLVKIARRLMWYPLGKNALCPHAKYLDMNGKYMQLSSYLSLFVESVLWLLGSPLLAFTYLRESAIPPQVTYLTQVTSIIF